MVDFYLFTLVVLLAIKIYNHYKYLSIIHHNTDKDLQTFLFDIVNSDEIAGESLGNFLKIILPVFQSELLDTNEEEYLIYKKVIHWTLLSWWIVAFIGGYFLWL